MLLVMDVGNTQTVLGVFEGEKLLAHWRISTDLQKVSDEYWILLRNLLSYANIPLEQIKGLCVSSVVPPLQYILDEICSRFPGCDPLFIEPGIKTGLSILYDDPREVGADRIANAVAAYNLYGAPIIVVDFGTATTFCAISKAAEYVGGVIFPGMLISAEALFQRAAKLPRVEFTRPDRVIGKDTVSSIKSGLIYGYAELVDGIVRRMKGEMGGETRVIASGGLAAVVANVAREIEFVDPFLTVVGLRIIYDKNRPPTGGGK